MWRSDRANTRMLILSAQLALIPNRRQQGSQVLQIETKGRQNRVHPGLGGRLHSVLQERGQSTRRSNINVAARPLLLQSRRGFEESNRPTCNTPEIVVSQVRQNG